MSTNPTHNPDEFSRELLREYIRPEIETYLGSNFQDPESSRRGTSISGEPGEWPPLVVTALPEGGRVLYPHVVIHEQSDASERPDPARDLAQHDFAVDVAVHGTTTTEMYNLRDTVRGWFERNRDGLEDVGLADPTLDGNAGNWDPTSKTMTWQLTLEGLVHTHPDSTYSIP